MGEVMPEVELDGLHDPLRHFLVVGVPWCNCHQGFSPLVHLVEHPVDVGGDAHRDREGADAEGVVHDARVLGHLREELLVKELDAQ